MTTQASAGSKPSKRAYRSSLGLTRALLPRDHLTGESAIRVDLDKETVRLPLYTGAAMRTIGARVPVPHQVLDARGRISDDETRRAFADTFGRITAELLETEALTR